MAVEAVPGLAEARAAAAAARDRHAGLTARLAAAEDACEAAGTAREAVVGQIARGADVQSADIAAATGTVTTAEGTAAVLREALAGAAAAGIAADRAVAAVLREALRQRVLATRTEAAAAWKVRAEATAAHSVVAKRLMRLEQGFAQGAGTEFVEYLLALDA